MVAAALAALLVTSVFAYGAFRARALPPAHTDIRGQIPRPNPKDEGKWFQLSHFGTSQPAPDARAKALAKAAKLPHSPLGGTARQVSGANATASPALATSPATFTALGPQALDPTL